jgi:glycosyltransferase involved in cell wall biosynthesis
MTADSVPRVVRTDCEPAEVLLSVIICTRSRPLSLRRTLESLLAQEALSGAWEIVVVDNGATDATPDVIRSFATRGPVRYAKEPVQGLGRARNRGIAEAHGSLLAFTDDDVVVHPDWARRIVERFAAEPGVAAVFGYVYADPGVPSMFSLNTRRHASYIEGKHRVFESTGGNNMAYRRSVVERIGVFDPLHGSGAKYWGADDAEFQYRFFKAGLKAFYDPEIKAKHMVEVDIRQFEREILRSDAGLAAWYGKHAAQGDLFALRLFVIHFVRNIMGVRSLVRAVRDRNAGEIKLRARRCRVLLQAFCSRVITELRT